MQTGLQEMTSDISKLVNLKVLKLEDNFDLQRWHASIGYLQRLEHLHIDNSTSEEVPAGFGMLASMTKLYFRPCGGMQVFPDLQVSRLSCAYG
jgi:hypothetical protein